MVSVTSTSKQTCLCLVEIEIICMLSLLSFMLTDVVLHVAELLICFEAFNCDRSSLCF